MYNKNFILKLIAFTALFFILDFCISKFLLNGLEKYYGLNDDTEIVLVGHSHLMLGVDKRKMERELGVGVSKYTREGVNVTDRKIMTQQVLRKNKKINTLIYGIDAWTFTSEGLSNNSHKLFYPFLNDSVIDSYVSKNSDLSEYLSKKIIKTSRYDELLISSSFRGYLGKWTNLKFGKVDVENLRANIRNGDYRKIENTDYNIEVLRETLDLLAKKNIRVILLYVPTIVLLTKVQEPAYNETIALFDAFSKEFDNVEFLNLQEPWSKEYDLFYDPIHLNPEGQSVITEKLIHYLKISEK
ncbi:SGNH/GDSL hydrolase family protein [Costertonia aggregata]|uniref:SGNH/GDSL hydrolase family protein n=1 Tax=Costertonia aggregata TaxID=343403 RepID=A0A7H9AMH4_9FLAO|nr:hypothetical protein [Costertonia aggregata]QLG44573.1 hypothetical protein HYG79_04165 [Costertonia aggregata]